MFRLIFMTAIACVLWPIDENNERLGVSNMEVSSIEVLSAGTAILSDVGNFCERNVETCVTGGRIITSVTTEFQAQVSQLSNNQSQTSD